MSQKSRSFSQPKHCLFEQAILLSSNAASFRNRHRKFAPSHNLLSAKNMAIFSMSALNPYAVTPEPRTDSKPFRRRLVRKTGFGTCRRKLLQKYFRQSFESSPGVQRVATLGVFLWYFLHAAKSTNPFPFRELRGSANLDSARRNGGFALTKSKPSQRGDSRFCKPRISPLKRQLHTNPIKSFCRWLLWRQAAKDVPFGGFALLFVRHKK